MYNANTTLIIKIFSQYKYIILDIFCGPNMKSKHTVTEVLYVRPRIITLLIYFYRSINPLGQPFIQQCSPVGTTELLMVGHF